MSEESEFEPYEVSIGTVICHCDSSGHYITTLTDGRTVGIPPATEPSAENFEADAAAFVASNGL